VRIRVMKVFYYIFTYQLSLILNKYLLYLFIINLNRLGSITVLNSITLIIKNLNIQHKSK